MDATQAISIRNRIVGILIRRARIRAGKSQRACAEFLGCSPFTFGQYELGRKGISLPELEALAHLLDTPVTSLWNEAHPPPEEPPGQSLPLAQLILLRRKILAVQFRQCRQDAGLTQQELGQLLGCSAYIVSQYERGKRDIPLAELEVSAEQCGRLLADFLDDQMIPASPVEQDRQTAAVLNELPSDVRDFVLNPTNALYLRIAMLLSSLKADNLRQIAETLLEITY